GWFVVSCCCLGGEGVAPWPCRAPVAHGLVAVSWWPLWSGVHRFFRLARAAARGAAVGDGPDRRAVGELTRARRGRHLGTPCAFVAVGITSLRPRDRHSRR